MVRQSKSLSRSRNWKNYASLESCPQSYKKSFQKETLKILLVTARDVRSQILSILDRRNGVEEPVFKFTPPGHEHLFDLTAPDLCEPSILMMWYGR